MATKTWVNIGLGNASCLAAPSHKINQCWLIIKGVLQHSPETDSQSTTYMFGDYTFKITATSPRSNELYTLFVVSSIGWVSSLCCHIVLYGFVRDANIFSHQDICLLFPVCARKTLMQSIPQPRLVPFLLVPGTIWLLWGSSDPVWPVPLSQSSCHRLGLWQPALWWLWQQAPVFGCGPRWISNLQVCHVLIKHNIITVTSWWGRWRLQSPASWWFAQPFVQAQIKQNIKALRHWPLWVTGGFPLQMANNAEIFSIWGRHHVTSVALIGQYLSSRRPFTNMVQL